MTATAQAADKAGKGAPEARPQHVGWSQAAARPGQEVQLVARLTGYGGESEVTFKVFSASKDPGQPLATLKAFSDDSGVAVTKWTVKFDAARDGDPKLLFEASTPDGCSISPALTVVDSCEVALSEEGGNPLAGLEIGIVDGSGQIHLTKVPPDGKVQRDVPIGEFSLIIKDHVIVGEKAAGTKRFSTGKAHRVVFKRMTFTIELVSPRDGEVFFAGDRIQVEARVLRAGKEEKAEPAFTASGARLDGEAGATQTGAGGQKPVLVLGDQDGEVTLEAAFMGAKATAKLKVLKPTIKRIEIVDADGNLIELHDHRDGKRGPGFYEFDAAGRPAKVHPAAVKLGTKLKAKVFLHHDEKPSRPITVDLALLTQDLSDEGLPEPSDKKLANKRITLALPADKQEQGVQLSGDWAKEAFELESDRELPAAVRVHQLKLEARIRVKGPAGWSGEKARPRMWAKIAQLADVPLFGVWAKPEVGDGSPQSPGACPLKETELDAFHMGHAARWADGGWNLLPNHEGSILQKLLANLGHYRHPDDYEGKDGRPKAAHPRPDNLEVLALKGVSEGERPVAEAPAPDDKLEVEVQRRGGTGQRSAATDISFHVVTSGALKLDLEMGDGATPLLFRYLVDGAAKGVTEPLAAKKKVEGLELGPVAPGPHVVTLAPEVAAPHKLESWRGKAVIHFSKPKPGEAKPTDKNWGWGVLDNPVTPGGKSHQAASAVAAALCTLGVKAGVNMIRARENGAINLVLHDPITVGASCFDPAKHWGQNLIAFAAVPVDKRRDQDPVFKDKGALHADHALVLDLRTKKIAPAKSASITGHARRKPKRDKLVRQACRCGLPFPPEGWVDWAARIASGAPFQVALKDVKATKEQWGKIKPGGTYDLTFVSPDKFVASGPTTDKVTFSASLDGKFWSFSEWPSGAGKSGHAGKQGKHKLAVNATTGAITVKLGGGAGTYQVFFYKNEKQEGPMVATCGPNGAGLKLTAEAKAAGWRVEGPVLVPPQAVVEGGSRLTASHADAGAVPEKGRLNIWGHPFAFDNSGAVTDPAFPDMGVVGELKAAGIEPFQAAPTVAHKTFPIRMIPAFDRRYHHSFVQRVEEFETQVDTEGVLRLLPSVPRCPPTMNVLFRLFVDGAFVGAQTLPAQKPAWVEAPVKKGSRKVKAIALVQGHGPAPEGIEAALTVETSKKPEAVKRHPVSGAQPCWGYEIDKDNKLEDALIQSIIYISPAGVTVHEEDDDCWASGDKLTKRNLTEGWIV